MNEDKLKNQIPILRFLNKHKWRIILPILITTVYFGLPQYYKRSINCQYSLFIISSRENVTNEQLNKEITDVTDRVRSDKFFRRVIAKYDFFAEELERGIEEAKLIEKLQRSMMIVHSAENIEKGVMIFIRVNLGNEDPQKAVALSKEIVSQFEDQPNFQIMKYTTPPFEDNTLRNRKLVGMALWCGIFSLLLILIWEIPFIFYSQKTKEMIFEPLKSDWQSELIDAKLNNRSWEAMRINICYSYAFLAAMLQKSPIGNLIEFISKFAKN